MLFISDSFLRDDVRVVVFRRFLVTIWAVGSGLRPVLIENKIWHLWSVVHCLRFWSKYLIVLAYVFDAIQEAGPVLAIIIEHCIQVVWLLLEVVYRNYGSYCVSRILFIILVVVPRGTVLLLLPHVHHVEIGLLFFFLRFPFLLRWSCWLLFFLYLFLRENFIGNGDIVEVLHGLPRDGVIVERRKLEIVLDLHRLRWLVLFEAFQEVLLKHVFVFGLIEYLRFHLG